MFFPYRDDNPRVLFPFVTYGIIIVSVGLFLIQFYFENNDPAFARNIVLTFGFVPAELNPLQIFSSMFLHGGFFHLIGNMWYLYLFGDNVEGILGHKKFLLFYLSCGVGAALLQFIINPMSTIPMIGASGAIAGILGAYMIRFPRARIHIFVFIIFFFKTIYVPAQIVLGIWFIAQLSNGFTSINLGISGGVAWFAHIGGFVIGILTLKFFQQFRIESS